MPPHRTNPFQFGRELGPDELVDRVSELNAIGNTLSRAGKLFLIGPRRYGKTSLLRVAATRAESAGVRVMRYDAQAFPGLTELAERIAADTVTRLTPTFEKAAKAARELFRSLSPRASFDAQDGTWTLSLAGAQGRTTPVPLLVDVLDGVERAAQQAKRKAAIVLDEFQEVIEQGGSDAEEQIRAAIQRHSHVAYVFAGSKTRMLTDMVSNHARPFYRLGAVHFLGPVPRDDFATFIADGFASAGLTIHADGATAVLDLADDVPYNVQLLASACWEWADTNRARGRGAGSPVSAAVVSDVCEKEARRLDPLYTQIWAGLTVPQRQAARAVVAERGVGLTSTNVSKRYKLPTSTMQRALSALELKLLVRLDGTTGAERYRLDDPLFAAWIRILQSLG